MHYVMEWPVDERGLAHAVCTRNQVEHRRIPTCVCGCSAVPTGRILPLKIALTGDTLGDIVWSDAAGLIVSKTLANILAENEVSGYVEHDLEIEEVHGDLNSDAELPSLLTHLWVTGSGGRARTLTPGIHLRLQCKLCGNTGYSSPSGKLVLSKDEYDGSDFFYCEEYGHLMVTERVISILRDNGIENYDLTEVELR